MSRDPARCGTPSGYNAHQNRGEKPCDACARAKREYDQRNRSAPLKTVKNRLTARAQNCARSRLADLYPDVYRTLFQEEKERVFREAGLPVWAFGEGRGKRENAS